MTKRHVITRKGEVAVVTSETSKFCIVQTKNSDPYYVFRLKEDLEDISEEEFKRRWPTYK